MKIKQETKKILDLLSNEQIDWGNPYYGDGYSVMIPQYRPDEFLETNLDYVEMDIMLQLSLCRQREGAKKTNAVYSKNKRISAAKKAWKTKKSRQ